MVHPSPPEGPPPPAPGPERRQHPRARGDWPVSIETAEGRYEARVRDVSEAGVCFFLEHPVREMSILKVELDLALPEGQRRVIAQGAVVRCEKISAALDHYEVAVFLHDIAEPDRRWLRAFVQSRDPH